MFSTLPKLFRRPEVLHDMVCYRFPHVDRDKFDNYLRMNRTPFDRESGAPTAFPYMLQLEPSSRCNLKCPGCPCGRGDLPRPSRDMTLAEFRGLIDDMERYLLFLILWDWGEPFMNRELPAMIRYAAERGIQAVTSTNCHFLHDEAYVSEILRAGLSTLIVAVDTTAVDSYLRYRRQGSGDRVIEGVRRLVDLKRRLGSPTRINLRMVLMHQTGEEIAATRAFARELGVDIFSIKTANPSCDGTHVASEIVAEDPRHRRYRYDPRTGERLRSNRPCRTVWTMSTVQSNGDVVPCTRDFEGGMKVGNVFEEPFTRIWQSEGYRALRRKVARDKAEIEKCRKCDLSFKFSRTGWFYEYRELPEERLTDRLRNTLLSPKARTLLHQMRKRV